MFDLGWSKLVLLAIVALIVIGPKELPAVLRTAGQWMARIRRMAAEFQNQFQEAMREAEMAELKEHIDQIHGAAKDLTSTFNSRTFNPIETVRSEIQRAVEATPATSAAALTAEPAAPAVPPADPALAQLAVAEELPPAAPAPAPETAAPPPPASEHVAAPAPGSEPERPEARGAA